MTRRFSRRLFGFAYALFDWANEHHDRLPRPVWHACCAVYDWAAGTTLRELWADRRARR